MDEKTKILQIAGKFGSPDAVKYTEQELTDDQKTQARKNIGAISEDEVPEQNLSIEDIEKVTAIAEPAETIFEQNIYLPYTTTLHLVEGRSYTIHNSNNRSSFVFNSDFSGTIHAGAIKMIMESEYRGTGDYLCKIEGVLTSSERDVRIVKETYYKKLDANCIPLPDDKVGALGGVIPECITNNIPVGYYRRIERNAKGHLYVPNRVIFHDSFTLTALDFGCIYNDDTSNWETRPSEHEEINNYYNAQGNIIVCYGSGDLSDAFEELKYPVEVIVLDNSTSSTLFVRSADGASYLANCAYNTNDSTDKNNPPPVSISTVTSLTSFFMKKYEEVELTSTPYGLVEGETYCIKLSSYYGDETIYATAVYSEALGEIGLFCDGNKDTPKYNRLYVTDTSVVVNSSWASNVGGKFVGIYANKIAPTIPKEAVIGLNDSAGILTVTAERDQDGNMVASHSSNEIYEAFQSGKTILLNDDDYTYQLLYVDNAWAEFSMLETYNGYTFTETLNIDESAKIIKGSDGMIQLYPANFVILNSSTDGSTKQFRITVDDTGTLSAEEVPQ